MASHTVLVLGLVVVGMVLFTIFFLNTSAWRFSVEDKDGRLTFAEWVERATHEDDDAQRG